MTAAPKNTITKSSVTATCCIMRAALLASLAEAKGYVASKNAVLSSVCLSFSEAGALKLTATDITRWYFDTLTVDAVSERHVDAPNQQDITVTCDAKRLHDVVKAMDADETVLTLKGTLTKTVTTIGDKSRVDHESLVQVVSSTGEYNIKGPDSTLFPKTPDFPSQWATYDANALRSALDISKPFVSKDLTRTHLCAALVEIAPDKISVISTDGHRLAKIVRPATHVVVAPSKFLVHLEAIGDLLDRCKVITKAGKYTNREGHSGESIWLERYLLLRCLSIAVVSLDDENVWGRCGRRRQTKRTAVSPLMSDEHESLHRCEEWCALDSDTTNKGVGDDLLIWRKAISPYLMLNSVEPSSFPLPENRVAL